MKFRNDPLIKSKHDIERLAAAAAKRGRKAQKRLDDRAFDGYLAARTIKAMAQRTPTTQE